MARDRRIRVALFATHPVQYHIPWFQQLAAAPELDLKVFFGLLPDAAQQGVGFGVGFQWDIPLLEGYRWELLRNVARKPSLGAFGGCDTPEVGRVLREWQPEAAIVTGWQSRMLVQGWWACIRLGIPRIIRGESNHLAPRPAWKRLGHRLWLRGFDRFLAIGQSNRAFYREAGVPAGRIHDCPYFIDNHRFATAAAELRPQRENLRRDWGVPDDATCFLFAGKLIPKKHPLDLLHALGRAERGGARAHALVVGTGELLAPARELAEREQLPVTFAGFLNQTEIVKAYVAADCLVLPSDHGETWGLVVNEAMACGLPAIVSDRVGCGPDLIIAGETGAVFPMGDVAALANRLVEFAANPARLPVLGERARQRVLADYSVERAVAGTLAAVRAVVKGDG
jgi:glycosyltransferase involved in cell wall biosynthesis